MLLQKVVDSTHKPTVFLVARMSTVTGAVVRREAFIVIAVLVLSSTAQLQSYLSPSLSSVNFLLEPTAQQQKAGIENICRPGQRINYKGECVKARVTRKIFLFSTPDPQRIDESPAPPEPPPRIHYNYVFIQSPRVIRRPKSIIVPPPKQKTLIYVLSKLPASVQQKVIDFPIEPDKPEVYFVDYVPGENADLLGGISLNDALNQSPQPITILQSSDNSVEASDKIHSPDSEVSFQLGVSSPETTTYHKNYGHVTSDVDTGVALTTGSRDLSAKTLNFDDVFETLDSNDIQRHVFIKNMLSENLLQTEIDTFPKLNRPKPVAIFPPGTANV